MRKFVIKNRQKRKYTKKSEEIHSLSSSKTAYGMIPLLVMLIAFMSTMIISAPVRDAFTHISFTFELPRFSLTNPLNFFQTVVIDITQFGMLLWTITQSFAGAISQSFVFGIKQLTSDTFLVVNFFTLFGSMLWSGCLFVITEISTEFVIIGQFINYIAIQSSNIFQFIISSIAIQCSTFFQLCVGFIANTAIETGQAISTITVLIIHQTAFLITAVVHYSIVVVVAIINFMVFLGKTALTLIVSAATAIGVFITRIFLAIVHTIEIPFKVLYAFWLLIKPYVDFFGKHVRMSGADFSNMVTSMYKVTTIMNATK